MTDNLVWSLEEAARRLGGVSTRTVRRLLQAGENERRRVGRRLLVCAASVRLYVDRVGPEAQNRHGAGPELQEESTCRTSADQVTRTVSIGGKTRRTGGQATRTQAAEALAAALGLATGKKQTHFSRSGGSNRTPNWAYLSGRPAHEERKEA